MFCSILKFWYYRKVHTKNEALNLKWNSCRYNEIKKTLVDVIKVDVN